MYKATAKNIKWLKDSEFSQEVIDTFKGIQPLGYEVAYYTPSYANWSYRVMITPHAGNLYEAVTQFGEVVGGRLLYNLSDRSIVR
jgi:hypothetical protein